MIHIIKTGSGEYMVIEPYSINENHYSRIHFRDFSFENASKYAIMLEEMGPVPVNAMAAGPGGARPNISTFTPLLKIRQALSRKKKKAQS